MHDLESGSERHNIKEAMPDTGAHGAEISEHVGYSPVCRQITGDAVTKFIACMTRELRLANSGS